MKQLIDRSSKGKDRWRTYTPILAFFIFLIGLATYTIIKKNHAYAIYLSSEFGDSLTEIYKERSTVHLKLRDGSHWSLKESANFDYSPVQLSQFLQEGDRLSKHSCSDTLYVERNGVKFHFLIGHSDYNNPNETKEFIEKSGEDRDIINKLNDCVKSI